MISSGAGSDKAEKGAALDRRADFFILYNVHGWIGGATLQEKNRR